MNSDTMPCPEKCGGVLIIDPACVIEEEYIPGYVIRGRPLPTRRRTVPAALCTRCEFCIEIQRG